MQVRSLSVYEELTIAGRLVFEFSNRLPDVVHNLSCGSMPFFDPDAVYLSGAWSMASSLAAIHDDPVVHFMTIEPDVSYFLDSAGCYGAFSVGLEDEPESYSVGLLGLDPLDSGVKIGYLASVVALFGDSGRWGIWSERNILGVGVTDYPAGIADWEIQHAPFVSAEDALEGILPMNFGGAGMPDSFAATLEQNYGVFGVHS